MPAASVEPPSTSPIPELKDANDDYERGDFSSARRRARTALEETTSDEGRRQAKSLLDKMGTDRAVWILLVVSLLFLVITFVGYAGRT